MKHRKREPGTGVSSTKSNISRAMRGRVPKVPNFLAMRNQQPTAVTTSHSEYHASSSSTTPAAAAQNTRTSDRTRRSPSHTDSKVLHPTPLFCLHQNDPAEREMWNTFNHHPNQSPSQCNI